MAMTLDQILPLLKDVAPTGTGFKALCPAHDDKNASLSVSQGRDGAVLVKCHANCGTAAVCAAIGIGLGDLFPTRNGKATAARREVTAYDYTDESGKLLFQVVRFEPK